MDTFFQLDNISKLLLLFISKLGTVLPYLAKRQYATLSYPVQSLIGQ